VQFRNKVVRVARSRILHAMRAGAAVSRAEDVRLAARDAATRALDAAGLDQAACLVVAATPEHLDESVELCEALRDAAGPNAQIVGGATSAALVPGDAETEEGPALGVLALEQRGELFSFRSDARTSCGRRPNAPVPALRLVFADPSAPLQRLLGALASCASPEAEWRSKAGSCSTTISPTLTPSAPSSRARAAGGGAVAPGDRRADAGHAREGRSLLELDSHPAMEALSALSSCGRRRRGAPVRRAGALAATRRSFLHLGLLSIPLLAWTRSGDLGDRCPDSRRSQRLVHLRDGMGARRTLQQALERLAAPRSRLGVYFDCASRGSTLYGVSGWTAIESNNRWAPFPPLAPHQLRAGPGGRLHRRPSFTGVLAVGDR